MDIIELDHLKKTFRDFWFRPTVTAVRDVTLRVRTGEVFGLLGPNGSGKSTTIKMILGLLTPSQGGIHIFGGHPRDMTVKARIGYLPELSYLHPFLTPRETLDYYASLFGLSRRVARQRTDELLAMVSLDTVADRVVGEFSKGMARRVGLAQALINAPDLLILDEPTSGLDPIGTRDVKDIVRLLAAHGVTVLMTSHLLADVEDVCDRIAIMNHGVVTAEGPVRDLLRRTDAVRFTVDALDENTVARARAALEVATGAHVRQDSPEMSLERYFLQTVTDADTRTFQLAPFLDRHV